MVEHVKFVSITRTIDTRNGPNHGIHYLDAIDENGMHWFAEMTPHQEKWLTYQKLWTRDPQQPYPI